MENYNPSHDYNFAVKIIKKTIVKAPQPSPKAHTIPLSNLDLLSGRFPVTYIYFYKTPCDNDNNNDFASIVKTLKSSLSQCLTHFYPFAGTISRNPKSNELEITCDNNGVSLVEAQTNIPLKMFNFYDLNNSLKIVVSSIENEFLTHIQITNFRCTSISLAFTFDHALGDASAFSKFLTTWGEIAVSKPIVTCCPNHSRNLLARVPPLYDPSLDNDFISCTIEDIANIPTIQTLHKRLYFVDKSSIDRLQRLATSYEGNTKKRTKIEAFSAYIWKVMAKTIEEKLNLRCKIGILIDGRSRITTCSNSMEDYIGNVLSVAFAEMDVSALNQKPISDIADTVHESISGKANEAHFRNLIDWIERHKPGLVLSKNVLGLGGSPAIVVSSGRNFPVGEVEFGFGRPLLGTVCSSVERLGVGYVNQRESAGGDGSWVVSTILWPEMVEALESDPDRVFQPMNLDYILGL